MRLRSKKLKAKKNIVKSNKQVFKVVFVTFKANILIYFEN